MLKLIVVGAIAAIAATAASAQSIPDANYTVAAYSLGPADVLSFAGTASSSGTAPNGSTSSTASATGGQTVSTSGMSSGFIGPDGTTPSALGVAAARYYFEITGPSSVPVRLLISGGGSLSATGDGDASVSYSFFQGDMGGAAYTNDCTAGSPYCGAFTYSDRRSLLAGDGVTPGVIGSVQIRADFGAGNGSASALIDPMITIDPTFADADLYTITFSNGVTNGGSPSAAPEPATWAMMIAGFGLVGIATRRRRTIAGRVAFAG